jgi:hypothetical protein
MGLDPILADSAPEIKRPAREVHAMVRIRRKLDSETLYLPELRPLIGKTVEIIIQEEADPRITSGTGDWEAAEAAARRLRETGYDFDAWREQRDFDAKHATDHLP